MTYFLFEKKKQQNKKKKKKKKKKTHTHFEGHLIHLVAFSVMFYRGDNFGSQNPFRKTSTLQGKYLQPLGANSFVVE